MTHITYARARARKACLGLKVQIAIMPVLLVLRYARVPQLQYHLPEQNPSRVHVRHRDDVFWTSQDERGSLEKKRKGVEGERTTVIQPAKEPDAILALHSGADRITQKLGLGSQFADDGDVVGGRYVVESGDGWMVRD
jgi:hypothetical protein